jgi:hypothetical protein
MGKCFQPHGLQFKASTMETVPPTTANGIERCLGSGLVKGIGPILAKKLVGRFGESNPLPCDLLVVDETSMVDVLLMHSLVRALSNLAHEPCCKLRCILRRLAVTTKPFDPVRTRDYINIQCLSLADALDSDHGYSQASHRKASAASYWHLRSLQLAFHVQQSFTGGSRERNQGGF